MAGRVRCLVWYGADHGRRLAPRGAGRCADRSMQQGSEIDLAGPTPIWRLGNGVYLSCAIPISDSDVRLTGQRDQPTSHTVPGRSAAEWNFQQLHCQCEASCPKICWMHFAAGPPVIDHASNYEELTDECWRQNSGYGRWWTWQSCESHGAFKGRHIASHHEVGDERPCDGRIKNDRRRRDQKALVPIGSPNIGDRRDHEDGEREHCR